MKTKEMTRNTNVTVGTTASIHSLHILPLIVKDAVEVLLPTVKVTVPESAVVTPLSVRLCTQPSVLIRFISLFCSGTSWSFHWAVGASS